MVGPSRNDARERGTVARTLVFNKPYGVLSQFTDADGHPGLKRFVRIPGASAVGRLDHDSEGLLVLSDEPGLSARIADPRARVAKTYRVQVEGAIDADDYVTGEAALDGLPEVLAEVAAHRRTLKTVVRPQRTK